MENKGLLSAVRKYPIGSLDPKENFLTEALCFVLNQSDQFSQSFMNALDLANSKGEISWETQVYANGAGFIDLYGESDEHVLVIENKIDAIFQENQVGKYFDFMVEKMGGAQKIKMVTITKKVLSDNEKKTVMKCKEINKSEPLLIGLTWNGIVNILETTIQSIKEGNRERFYLEELKLFIKNEVSPDMEIINAEALKYYGNLKSIDKTLKAIFFDILDEEKKNKYGKDSIFSGDNIRIGTSWGRVGIEFSKAEDWNPGLFYGVLLDNSDHRFKFKPFSPLLCVVVSMDRKFHQVYKKQDAYNCFIEELKTLNGWEVNAESDNPWQPICIYKKLDEELKEALTIDRQREKLKEGIEIVEKIAKFKSYADLKEALVKTTSSSSLSQS